MPIGGIGGIGACSNCTGDCVTVDETIPEGATLVENGATTSDGVMLDCINDMPAGRGIALLASLVLVVENVGAGARGVSLDGPTTCFMTAAIAVLHKTPSLENVQKSCCVTMLSVGRPEFSRTARTAATTNA